MSPPDPLRSEAVLVGVGSYANARVFPELRQVELNVNDLGELLRSPSYWGLPEGRCRILVNPASAQEIAVLIAKAAQRATDTLFVYLAGHGMVSENGELLIALPDTDAEWPEFTALRYSWIREALLATPVPRTVVVVDSCFSGRAITAMSEARAMIAGQLGIQGAYLLTSVPPNEIAVSPRGAIHTAFTGALIKTIRDGIPGGTNRICLGDLYSRVRREMIEAGHPQPMQMGTNTIAELPLVRNVMSSGRDDGVGKSERRITERGEQHETTRNGAAVLFSIVGYKEFSPLDQVDRTLRFADVLDESLKASDVISGSWSRQPTRDGELIILANGEAAVSSVVSMMEVLATRLRHANANIPRASRLGITATAHTGPVRKDGNDFSGSAIDTVMHLGTSVRIGWTAPAMPFTAVLTELFSRAAEATSILSPEQFTNNSLPNIPRECRLWQP